MLQLEKKIDNNSQKNGCVASNYGCSGYTWLVDYICECNNE